MSPSKNLERPLLSFSRATLDAGPREVRAPLPAAWLAAQFAQEEAEPSITATEDGEIDARLTSAGDDNFLLQGRVRAKATTSCARCLGPAVVPLDADVTLLFVPDKSARPTKGRRSRESDGELEFDPSDADVAPWDGETLVLDPLVREALLLELPISPLCDEACPGIASPPSGTPDAPVGHRAFREKLAALQRELSEDPKKS